MQRLGNRQRAKSTDGLVVVGTCTCLLSILLPTICSVQWKIIVMIREGLSPSHACASVTTDSRDSYHFIKQHGVDTQTHRAAVGDGAGAVCPDCTQSICAAPAALCSLLAFCWYLERSRIIILFVLRHSCFWVCPPTSMSGLLYLDGNKNSKEQQTFRILTVVLRQVECSYLYINIFIMNGIMSDLIMLCSLGLLVKG